MNLLIVSLLAVVSANKVQQVHLSYWDNPSEMTVTWLTMHELDAKTPPFVSYGTDHKKLPYTVPASQKRFVDQSGKDRYTYRAVLTGLIPGNRYYYSTGSDDEMSDIYNFRAMDPSKPLRAAVFGDFGKKDGYSLDALINATQSDQFDMVFHIGDIAYDLDKKDGDTGDDFLNDIVPIAAYVPYHVIAGNHEHSQDFLHYKERFSMPPNGVLDDNQFWSITVGNTHVIGISSEYYAFNMTEEAQKQYQWLVNDLKQNKAPWTIVLMHRPMYCSNEDVNGCQGTENLVTRNGQPGLPALEPLFNSAGVDLVFWGHQHSYERNWPLFDGKAYPQSDSQHYHNSSTPVYIMSGSAGCHDHQDVSQKIQQPYTAVMFGDYGYSLLTMVSDTLVTTQFVSLNSTKPLDQFYLTKVPLYRPGMLFAPRI